MLSHMFPDFEFHDSSFDVLSKVDDISIFLNKIATINTYIKTKDFNRIGAKKVSGNEKTFEISKISNGYDSTGRLYFIQNKNNEKVFILVGLKNNQEQDIEKMKRYERMYG